MWEIHRENTAKTLAENENSTDEMDYSEMYTRFVGDFIPGRSPAAGGCLIGFVFLAVTLSLWATFGWKFYQKCSENAPGNVPGVSADTITAQKIRLVHRLPDGTLSPEIPKWIHENIVQQIMDGLPKENRSIYDEKLIEKVNLTLKGMCWIQEVHSIQKFYPAYLQIEVKFRRPVLLVVVHEKTDAIDRIIYIPVSDDCRVLPNENKDFPVSPEEIETFPIFCGVAPVDILTPEGPMDINDYSGYNMPPSRLPGLPWDRDTNISGAIHLINQLGSRWEKYGLNYICVEPQKSGETDFGPKFCIVTRNGSIIYWGRSSLESLNKNDISDTVKIAQLDEEYKKRGSLDQPPMCISFRHETVQTVQTP